MIVGELLKEATKANKANGIPDFSDFGSPEDLKEQLGKSLQFVRQLHNAERAGLHEDWRIGDSPKNRRMHSWAVPKGEPTGTQKHLAIHQPLHRGGRYYTAYKGEIKEGYGKGHVSIEELNKLKIESASPNKVVFTVMRDGGPKTMALIKTTGRGKRDWILLNKKPTT